MIPASHVFLGIMFYCEFLVSVFTGYLLGYLRFYFDSSLSLVSCSELYFLPCDCLDSV